MSLQGQSRHFEDPNEARRQTEGPSIKHRIQTRFDAVARRPRARQPDDPAIRGRERPHFGAVEALPLPAPRRVASVDLKEAGFETVLLETRHVKAALSAMTVKTDRKDARGLAQLLRMGWFQPVHAKSMASQEVRALLVFYLILGIGFIYHRQRHIRQAPVAERPIALPPEIRERSHASRSLS